MGVLFRETRLGTWGMQTEFPLFPPALPLTLAVGSSPCSHLSGGELPKDHSLLPTHPPSSQPRWEESSRKRNSLEAPWGRGGGELGVI